MFRQQPPSHLPRHLLFAVLAYRLQAGELGDLDPATARLLRQIATVRDLGCLAVDGSARSQKG
jgi:hypothetical protein